MDASQKFHQAGNAAATPNWYPEEIVGERGGLVTMMNREMMVAFINRHLPETANLDVRTSYVYYDEDGDFKLALHNKLEGPGADVAFKRLGIKFWSKGIK